MNGTALKSAALKLTLAFSLAFNVAFIGVAVFRTAPPELPTPVCGDLDHLKPAGDINGDCDVNLADIQELAQNWTGCSDPDR